MSQSSLIVACDLGTLSFRALVAEVFADGGLEVLGCSREPAEGFQDGDFVDLRAGSRCVARTLRELEHRSEIEIDAFSFNVSGPHLRSVWARGQIQIGPGPRTIGDRDLDRVMTKARSLAIPFDHQILAVNPVAFSVDRVGGIHDPRGRMGSQLEVQAHLITGSRSVVRNIENAVRDAGYTGAGHAVDVLAAAACLLTDAEKEGGVLLVDVGGLATQWAYLKDGRIAGVGQVGWGGAHLTRDLAHGLRTDLETAERIKRERGVVLRSLVGDADLDVLFEEDRPEETPGLVAAILEPRCEEILTLVKADLGTERPLSDLAAGVILTGGGSRCRGTRELCEEVFGIGARTRYLPPDLAGADRLEEGQWATALGLIMWGGGAEQAEAVEPDEESAAGGWRRWLRRLGGR